MLSYTSDVELQWPLRAVRVVTPRNSSFVGRADLVLHTRALQTNCSSWITVTGLTLVQSEHRSQ